MSRNSEGERDWIYGTNPQEEFEMGKLRKDGFYPDEAKSEFVSRPLQEVRERRQDLRLRWMIKRDYPIISQIDAETQKHAWDVNDYRQHNRRRNGIGQIVEDVNENALGGVMYLLHENSLEIVRLVSRSGENREDAILFMLAKLVEKGSHERRTDLTMKVDERDTKMIGILQKAGFAAVGREDDDTLIFGRLISEGLGKR